MIRLAECFIYVINIGLFHQLIAVLHGAVSEQTGIDSQLKTYIQHNRSRQKLEW